MIVYDELLHEVALEGKHTFISTGLSENERYKKSCGYLQGT